MSITLHIKNTKIITLPKIKDGRDGVLCVAEQNKNIPFDIKRVFYIYDLHHSNAIRGKHAHKKTEQVIFCINGNFSLLLDDGQSKQQITLNSPEIGVFIGTYVWNTLTNFSNDCILLVLASDIFNENDYIRDYRTFLKIIKNKT
jgi:dTDP-4-dehydrorhamnose 3,5-epimerase-like enzyme